MQCEVAHSFVCDEAWCESVRVVDVALQLDNPRRDVSVSEVVVRVLVDRESANHHCCDSLNISVVTVRRHLENSSKIVAVDSLELLALGGSRSAAFLKSLRS